MRDFRHGLRTLTVAAAALAAVASCTGVAGEQPPPAGTTDAGSPPDGFASPGDRPPPKPGQTEFTTEEQNAGASFGAGEGARTATGAPAPAPAADSAGAAAPGAPMGRMGEVEEGDIYRVSGDRLFYLNTYRGFVIYDLRDPKKPERLGRLPVFGYPIEMFVEGNTVYALLRDALYLTQVGDRLEFERHNVSQLVAIDVSDMRNPRLLKTIDIVGQLREGVSRKIENTVYVVSYIPQWYHWGWRQQTPQQKEQAWVYSFDVADRQNPKLVQKLQVFEGGSVSYNDPKSGVSYRRNFAGVYISATANALMVAENWHVWSYVNGRQSCGLSNSSQQAVVSIIDISDPKGTIRRHTRIEGAGHVTDQFKMTYVFDDAAKTGTFFGIFARQVWSAANCTGSFYTQNTIESWDITDGTNPRLLHGLNFGKPNEVVRGTSFDLERKVAYAITAQRIDPLYAISIADRRSLKILSAIDGLSGDISVFRLIGGRNFLLAIGQDNSNACTGFQDTSGWQPTKVAVSIIDVRDLTRIRLVQRACVAIRNAQWVGSQVNWNLDQAHKMIGMHSDGDANIITVPVYYWRKSDDSDWWWYRWETAVGIMSWDLRRYDPLRGEREQSVLTNHGTFVHPNGEVRRSIVFTHAGSGQRMMINLSDTHVSVANLQDLTAPRLESVIELAPFYNQIYRFGDHIVEQVQTRPSYGYGPGQDLQEFRVKPAGGDLDGAAPVATFRVGQVQRVAKHKESLVLFRVIQEPRPPSGGVVPPPSTEALVYDLRDPARPRAAGRVRIPGMIMPYYRFWCGTGAYWGGYWFDSVASWVTIDGGLVFHTQEYRYDGRTSTVIPKLVLVDLRNVDAPKVREVALPTGAAETTAFLGLVADPTDPRGFFMNTRSKVGETRTPEGAVFHQLKYFAQRWEMEGEALAAKQMVNTPGRLVRTFLLKGERHFLTQDQSWQRVAVQAPNGQTSIVWRSHIRLSLLREIKIDGKPAAELLDARTFTDLALAALMIDGERLYINGRPQSYGYATTGVTRVAADSAEGAPAPIGSWETTSDHLLIFDLSRSTLQAVYAAPTRAYNVQLMGTHQGKLFVNLQGDGVLVVDASAPGRPVGVRFLRTLGYASHIEFAGNDVYVAAGYFGLYHMRLDAPPDIPTE